MNIKVSQYFKKIAAMGALASTLFTVSACRAKDIPKEFTYSPSTKSVSSSMSLPEETLSDVTICFPDEYTEVGEFYEVLTNYDNEISLSEFLNNKDIDINDTSLRFDPNDVSIISSKVEDTSILIQELENDSARLSWVTTKNPFFSSRDEDSDEIKPDYSKLAAMEYIALNGIYLNANTKSYIMTNYNIDLETFDYLSESFGGTYSCDMKIASEITASKIGSQSATFLQGVSISDYNQFLDFVNLHCDTNKIENSPTKVIIMNGLEAGTFSFGMKVMENCRDDRSIMYKSLLTSLSNYSSIDKYIENTNTNILADQKVSYIPNPQTSK